MATIKIGQKLFVKPIGNAARGSTEIREAEVSKVGRKYFELKDFKPIRFFIDDMYHDGGQYLSNYRCYLTMQEILDEKEAASIRAKLRPIVEHGNLTINQLRLIMEIILPVST